jgi:hypothetical protein
MNSNDDVDFMLWYRADDAEDSDDFVSLHPQTPRAWEWLMRGDTPAEAETFLADVRCFDNAEARELRQYLEAEGFEVMCVS